MQNYIFTNVIGSFVFDEKIRMVEKGSQETLRKEFKCAEPGSQEVRNILAYFKKAEFFPTFRQKGLENTKQLLKSSVAKDNIIMQAIAAIQELDKLSNLLVRRLKEWHGLYNPELSMQSDGENFTQLVIEGHKQDDSVGADLEKDDLEQIRSFSACIKGIFEQRKQTENYLELLMEKELPNTKAVAGSLIGAKLMCQAGSLKRLSEMPASTIQVLGAEKALFRHMKTGAKPPKFGILYQHQLIQKAKRQDQGKVARLIADKISIAVKVDYFKGKYIGDKLLEDISKKMKK